MRVLYRAVHAFQKTQVELQGQYSPERLRHLSAYCANTSNLRVFCVLASMPLPCLALITLIEVLPMQSPARGLNHNALFFLRSAIVGFVIALSILEENRRFVTSLRVTFPAIVALALLVTCVTASCEVALAHLIGFPVPFSIFLSAPSRFVSIGVSLALWNRRELCGRSRVAREELFACQNRLSAQILFIVVYPLYNVAFQNLKSSSQTAFTLLLPLIKVFARNWIGYAFRDMEDVKPEMVIFNSEIFHALYVSVCMQSSTSLYTTVLLMGMDFVQFLASMVDVRSMLRTIAALQELLAEVSDLGDEQHRDTGSAAARRVGIDAALFILENDAAIQRHPSILGVARKMQVAVQRNGAVQLAIRGRSKLLVRVFAQHRVTAAPKDPRANRPDEAACGPHVNIIPDAPSETVSAAAVIPPTAPKVKYVQQILQLLHLVEFLLLIEFMEVVIPVIYCGYLLIVYSLPNREFYSLFKGIDEHEVWSKIGNVMLYAALEFASFVLLALVLRRKIQMSMFHQLAFAIESQWGRVQAKILVWVLFTTQLPLDHYGADPTFQFGWLEKP